MPNFNVSTQRLRVRPINQTELPPVRRMARGPSLEYLSYADGPRQYNARAATAGAGVAALHKIASAVNEGSLSYWLKTWLRNHEATIVETLESNDHSVFIVQVNYAVADTAESRVFMSRDIHLLGTVPTLDDVGTILTSQRLYGPKVDAIPPNNLTKFQYAYLIGQRL